MPRGVKDGRKTPWRNAQLLYRLYVVEDKTTVEIGDELDCAAGTVETWLRNHDITIDSDKRIVNQRLKDSDLLRKWYIENGETTKEISNRLDCSASTVGNWLKKHDIEIRDAEFDPILSEIEEKTIARRYKAGESLNDLADVFECSTAPIVSALETHGVETRSKGTSGGQDHPDWKGGKTLRISLRLQLSEQSWYKDRLKARESADGCELCGGDNGDKELDVHHIIPVLSGGCNEQELLMCLCRSCHVKVENYTQEYFEPIIAKYAKQAKREAGRTGKTISH